MSHFKVPPSIFLTKDCNPPYNEITIHDRLAIKNLMSSWDSRILLQLSFIFVYFGKIRLSAAFARFAVFPLAHPGRLRI